MVDEKATKSPQLIADWQRMLGQIIEDEHVLVSLADELGVHPDTIKRWTQGKTAPRNPARTLRALCLASPFPDKFRGAFSETVRKSFPDFQTVNPLIEDIPIKEIPPSYPFLIYRSFAYVEEHMVYRTITNTVCHWLFGHLDSDQSAGVSAMVLLCTPPANDSVRSFYTPIRQIGERPSPLPINFPLLVGLEASPFADSKPRYERPLVFNESEIRELTSLSFPAEVKSLLAAPIQRRGRLAGWFLVSSRRQAYWNDQRTLVAHEYSLFLGLAMADQDFYKREQFSLGVYPSAAIQQQQQATHPFGKRLMGLWASNRAMRTEQLEILALQELEEDLLREEETR